MALVGLQVVIYTALQSKTLCKEKTIWNRHDFMVVAGWSYKLIWWRVIVSGKMWYSISESSRAQNMHLSTRVHPLPKKWSSGREKTTFSAWTDLSTRLVSHWKPLGEIQGTVVDCSLKDKWKKVNEFMAVWGCQHQTYCRGVLTWLRDSNGKIYPSKMRLFLNRLIGN